MHIHDWKTKTSLFNINKPPLEAALERSPVIPAKAGIQWGEFAHKGRHPEFSDGF